MESVYLTITGGILVGNLEQHLAPACKYTSSLISSPPLTQAVETMIMKITFQRSRPSNTFRARLTASCYPLILALFVKMQLLSLAPLTCNVRTYALDNSGTGSLESISPSLLILEAQMLVQLTRIFPKP